MDRLSSLLRSLRVNFHITHFQFYIILRWCLSREECMLEQLKAFHINKKERKRMGWADGLVPQCFQLQYMPCMLPKLSTWTVFTCLFWFMYASLGTDANSTTKYHISFFQFFLFLYPLSVLTLTWLYEYFIHERQTYSLTLFGYNCSLNFSPVLFSFYSVVCTCQSSRSKGWFVKGPNLKPRWRRFVLK